MPICVRSQGSAVEGRSRTSHRATVPVPALCQLMTVAAFRGHAEVVRVLLEAGRRLRLDPRPTWWRRHWEKSGQVSVELANRRRVETLAALE